MHCTNGTIDNLTPDEDGCFEQVRTVLGYLPVVECTDDVNRADLSLRSLIPRRKVRIYNPYTVIENVVGRRSWFEIGVLRGRMGITGWRGWEAGQWEYCR